MSSSFIPAFLMAILHILSSFSFVDLSNIRVLRLFHDSTAKEIHSCISTPGQYCVVSFPFMDSSKWNKSNLYNLVAKIQVYMSNKTQTQIIFHYFENRDHIKICLTLWQKYIWYGNICYLTNFDITWELILIKLVLKSKSFFVNEV